MPVVTEYPNASDMIMATKRPLLVVVIVSARAEARKVDPVHPLACRSARQLTACERAGVRPIPIHATRKTCASLLVVLGVHRHVAMEILRHSLASVVMGVYAEVSSDAPRLGARPSRSVQPGPLSLTVPSWTAPHSGELQPGLRPGRSAPLELSRILISRGPRVRGYVSNKYYMCYASYANNTCMTSSIRSTTWIKR